MGRGRSRSLLAAALLLLPLAAILGWLAHGVWHPAAPPAGSAPATQATASSKASALPGLPAPQADLPPDRLHERVNGAEDYLRAQGCVRLLAWDLADPKASLEVLLFSSPEGARKVLDRDAGPSRTEGPGDEASADPQGILFRRGRAYVRLVADPEAPPDASRLLAEAAKVDRAILDGMGRGL
jgi:hypothetical protein